MKSLLGIMILGAFFFSLQGCGKKEEVVVTKRSTIADQVKQSFQKVTTIVDVKPDSKSKAEKKIDWKNPSEYFCNDLAVAIVVRPKQVLNSTLVQKLIELTGQKKEALLPQAKSASSLKLDDIDQMVILVDSSVKMENLTETVALPAVTTESEESSSAEKAEASSAMPTPAGVTIVHLAKPVDKATFLESFPSTETPAPSIEKPIEKKHAGYDYVVAKQVAYLFPDDRTVVIGKEEILKKLLSAEHRNTDLLKSFLAIDPTCDFAIVADFTTKLIKEKITQAIDKKPVLGQLSNVNMVTFSIKATGSTGDTLLSLDVETPQEANAKSIADMLNQLLISGKEMAANQVKRISSTSENKDVESLSTELIESLLFTHKKKHLLLHIPIPKSYDKLPEVLASVGNGGMLPFIPPTAGTSLKPPKPETPVEPITPVITVNESRLQKNNLRTIGNALRDYHETNKRLPRAIGDADKKRTGKLSWRVHLLYYLDEHSLYQKFHLDEDWDSPHNIKLVNQMPDVFKTPHVKEIGKTVVHVFTGKGTPFGDPNKGVSFKDFKEELGKTILVIIAGTETAEVWTKPGGVKFDFESPAGALGDTPEDGYIALFANNIAKALPQDIEDKTLKLIIQYAKKQ